MLKMGECNLFLLSYVCMLKENITKPLWKYLGEYIYRCLKEISSFMWGGATALHTREVELR